MSWAWSFFPYERYRFPENNAAEARNQAILLTLTPCPL